MPRRPRSRRRDVAAVAVEDEDAPAAGCRGRGEQVGEHRLQRRRRAATACRRTAGGGRTRRTRASGRAVRRRAVPRAPPPARRPPSTSAASVPGGEMRAVLLGRPDREHEQRVGRDRGDLLARERVPVPDVAHAALDRRGREQALGRLGEVTGGEMSLPGRAQRRLDGPADARARRAGSADGSGSRGSCPRPTRAPRARRASTRPACAAARPTGSRRAARACTDAAGSRRASRATRSRRSGRGTSPRPCSPCSARRRGRASRRGTSARAAAGARAGG